MSFRLPVSLIDRVNDVAYWTRVSINSIGVDAVTAEVKRLEDEFNNGKEFKPRPVK